MGAILALSYPSLKVQDTVRQTASFSNGSDIAHPDVPLNVTCVLAVPYTPCCHVAER